MRRIRRHETQRNAIHRPESGKKDDEQCVIVLEVRNKEKCTKKPAVFPPFFLFFMLYGSLCLLVASGVLAPRLFSKQTKTLVLACAQHKMIAATSALLFGNKLVLKLLVFGLGHLHISIL